MRSVTVSTVGCMCTFPAWIVLGESGRPDDPDRGRGAGEQRGHRQLAVSLPRPLVDRPFLLAEDQQDDLFAGGQRREREGDSRQIARRRNDRQAKRTAGRIETAAQPGAVREQRGEMTVFAHAEQRAGERLRQAAGACIRRQSLATTLRREALPVERHEWRLARLSLQEPVTHQALVARLVVGGYPALVAQRDADA